MAAGLQELTELAQGDVAQLGQGGGANRARGLSEGTQRIIYG